MPFGKFVDIETITEERSKAIEKSIRTISIEELTKTFGLWVLPGSGMGPLKETGKRMGKKAIKHTH